ncbi:trihelix transcription factor ASIL2-like isoform X2 [Hibiscus syriacus]|uniref:trihelix transcription factor ASIL2-like isoform X2 n=1 Tax=Hibiscus syriacus TaxID=106335 RepID=UPI001924CB1D|nr:trihelix transcription factor ASIL2-like isoform X2 [Hibiscus syriacus]
MADISDSVTPLAIITPPSTTPGSRTLPVREDCWSEEATSTLIDAWGRRYVELNRGNLRQKDWQDVADAVNVLHGHTKKTNRTDVQCKNRIDTIKKKYKIEKTTVAASNGTLTSSWPFFERLDALIGSNFTAKKVSLSPKISPKPSPRIPGSPPVALPLPLPYKRTPAPATVVALPQKRPAVDDGYFKRYYLAVAAAAAAAADVESDEEEGEESEGEESEGEGEEREGMKRLARAIERFGQVYERVEGEKLRQMVELEKQRMQFAKDLEVQRMRMFMDTQVQLEKIKRGKRSSGSSENGCFSIAGQLTEVGCFSNSTMCLEAY